MRDNIRLKQPFQFSLGVKQVVGALVASLVVLGAIFVLGLGVGRKSGPPAGQPAGARDALARLDEPLTGKEEAAPELKAHQALTDNRAIEKTMPIPTANAVAQAAVQVSPRAEEPAVPEHEIVMPPPIAAPGPAPLPLSASSAVTASPPPQPHDGPAPAASAPANPNPAASASPATARAAPPARAAKPSPHATARHRGPEKESKVAKSRVPAAHAGKAKGKGAYTIQIASAQRRADAERVAKRVAARRPRIVAADVPGKGRWYRVQIGSYTTRESAKLALASMPGVQGIVTPAR